MKSEKYGIIIKNAEVNFIMKYGLVLAGGGTRGAYQVGVMKALAELGIELSAVCGTSIGAINGVLFAQGDVDAAEKLWKQISIKDIINLPNDDNENILSMAAMPELIKNMKDGGLDISPLENLLKSLIDEDKLRKSNVDYGLVSVSVTNKKTERFFKEDIPYGKMHEYVIASAALPVFKEKKINGEKFTDGGISDNMPVDMLIDKGIKDIITVDVCGVGVKRAFCDAGINVIEINCQKPAIGMLDFDSDSIEKSINEGYYDAHKKFGTLSGEKYFFDTNEYIRLKRNYSEAILRGIEDAAKIFGVERIQKYSFENFVKETVRAYREYAAVCSESAVTALKEGAEGMAVVGLINMLKSGNNEFLKKKSDMLGKFYNAASALMYFERKFK